MPRTWWRITTYCIAGDVSHPDRADKQQDGEQGQDKSERYLLFDTNSIIFFQREDGALIGVDPFWQYNQDIGGFVVGGKWGVMPDTWTNNNHRAFGDSENDHFVQRNLPV